tara:strand:- start:3223 stop:4347 length:1125 start_codon:yes stop_codon:yes gene_type:complete
MIFLFSYTALAQGPSINVLIARSLQNVFVSGVDLKSKVFLAKSAKSYLGRKSLNFKCKPEGKNILPLKPLRLASVASMTGLLNWQEAKYRGNLHIITSETRAGCDLINEMPLEDYLATLLPKEMSADWPLEALKAQAVAARSYAYHKIKSKQVSKGKGFNAYYDIENSEKHQVNGNFFDATYSTFKATQETAGEVLTMYDGKSLPIFFHSKCGGKTLRPDQVWSNAVKGYKSVSCPFCHKHGTKDWKIELAKPKLSHYLKEALASYENQTMMTSNKGVKILSDKKSHSALRFYSKDDLYHLKKSRLRATLGRRSLPSNNYFVKDKGKNIVISGSGFGHGVGLCQFGAKELALRGFDYKQILNHYFPNFKLTKIY